MTGDYLKTRICCWLALATGALLGASRAAAQISLSSSVALALQNSTQVRMAATDVQRAQAGLTETKDAYIPNFVAGASPGPPSIGFPLGQPSLFNITASSLVYSFSQPDYMRAAHAALKAAQLSLKDKQDEVMLDCALAYVQLDTDTRKLVALDEEKNAAERLIDIEHQRLIAGVASRMDYTKAQITSAQVDLKRLHVQDDAAEQREKLQHLTGLPAASFIPETESIPPAPEFADDPTLADQAVASNKGIQAATANAKSKLELSFGDAKQNYRPQFTFGAQYSRFASFENYDQYYQHFTKDNFGAAVQITFPLFDARSRAKARESAADAKHAEIEAEQAKNEASEQVKTLQHSLTELKAQQRFAQLRSQLAQEQLESVHSELKNGTGSPNAAPVTPRDEELAQIQAQERTQDALDADLSVMRAKLSLMRTIGTIQDWIHARSQ